MAQEVGRLTPLGSVSGCGLWPEAAEQDCSCVQLPLPSPCLQPGSCHLRIQFPGLGSDKAPKEQRELVVPEGFGSAKHLRRPRSGQPQDRQAMSTP